jgi:L-malate glycosyltransferase
VGESLRVLVAGWLNSPHVTAWVASVAAAGHDVHLAGRAAPQWPALEPTEKVHPLAAHGPPLLGSLLASRDLARVAAQIEPDLVHALWLPEFGWMAARQGLHPLVSSAWGSDVLGTRGIGRRRSRRALDGSVLVLADSVALARAARALAGRDLPVEVVRWGLDLGRFAPGGVRAARESLGLAHEGPLVMGVRGLDSLYNPELLLEAFGRVHANRPDAQLLLKHPLEHAPPAVTELVERLGLGGAVVMLGNVPSERMPDVYRAADVVVSIPSSDSSPRSVWEALACGRPVVVSDLPWARDELVPDRHALLVPLDAEALAKAIGRVLDDRELTRRLGTESRELAIAELDPEVCTARIDAIYRSVAEAGA